MMSIAVSMFGHKMRRVALFALILLPLQSCFERSRESEAVLYLPEYMRFGVKGHGFEERAKRDGIKLVIVGLEQWLRRERRYVEHNESLFGSDVDWMVPIDKIEICSDITVSSTPSGASVYDMNGRFRGNTPCTLTLPVLDQWAIKVEYDGSSIVKRLFPSLHDRSIFLEIPVALVDER